MPLKRRKSRVPPPETCPLLECLAFLGSAWAPSVLWFLSAGPRRFSELRSDIPKVSAKVLSARLRSLEEQGVIARKVMPTSPPTVEYSLTELGQELMPAVMAIAEVGYKLKMLRAGAAAPTAKPSRKAA